MKNGGMWMDANKIAASPDGAGLWSCLAKMLSRIASTILGMALLMAMKYGSAAAGVCMMISRRYEMHDGVLKAFRAYATPDHPFIATMLNLVTRKHLLYVK
jgi:hypothetical protein